MNEIWPGLIIHDVFNIYNKLFLTGYGGYGGGDGGYGGGYGGGGYGGKEK